MYDLNHIAARNSFLIPSYTKVYSVVPPLSFVKASDQHRQPLSGFPRAVYVLASPL